MEVGVATTCGGPCGCGGPCRCCCFTVDAAIGLEKAIVRRCLLHRSLEVLARFCAGSTREVSQSSLQQGIEGAACLSHLFSDMPILFHATSGAGSGARRRAS